jgi:hypothetical protein
MRICAMRFITVRIAWLGVATAAAAAVSACVPVERNTVELARVQIDTVGAQSVAIPEIIRAAPEDLAERAVVGGILGGMLGAGVGAIASANPAFGAVIGGPAGAVIGGLVGIATTPPLPSYMPIAIPTAPVIPGFYDAWPPGYRSPPAGAQTPPPHPEWTPAFEIKPFPGAELPSADGLVPAEGPPSAPL